MATYLQQNLSFMPCSSKLVKKSFEQVMEDIGANLAPEYGTQCWRLKQNVIFFSVRKTKNERILLTYKIYMEQDFSEGYAKKTNSLIIETVKKKFASETEDTGKPCLSTGTIPSYIIREDIVTEQANNRQWMLWLVGGILALIFILDVTGNLSTVVSKISKPNSNNPEYYYGTWVSDKGKIEVTFCGNDVAKCKVVLGREPIEYQTEWAVSPNNGVFWGTYYGRGEYNFMTPEGHLYHYQKSGDRYTDAEVNLHKK